MPVTKEQAQRAVQNYEQFGEQLLSSFYGHIVSKSNELTQQQTLDRLTELQHHPLKEVGRGDGRFALPLLYMMSEGNMSLEQAMSSTTEQKQQYGQRYMDMLERQDEHEIAATWAKMGQTMANQPVNRMAYSSPEATTADFTRQAMLRNMIISHRQCTYETSEGFRQDYAQGYGENYQAYQAALDHACILTEGARTTVESLASDSDYMTSSAYKMVFDSAQDDLANAHSFMDIDRPEGYYTGSQSIALGILASDADKFTNPDIGRQYLNETSNRADKNKITFAAAPQMHPNKIIKAASQGRLSQEQSKYLSDTYDSTFNGIYSPHWVQALERSGKSPFDLIYIDGKPASEAFASKVPQDASPEQREAIMKQQVALTALSSKARIDYTIPKMNSFGEVSVSSPVALKVDIQAPEKKPNLWERFKAFVNIEPIPQSRQQVAQQLMSADPELTNRQLAISSNIAHKKNVERLEQSDNKFFGHLKNAQDKNLTVDEVIADFKSHEESSQVHNVDRPSARNGLVELYAMSQGMTIDQIMSSDPQYDAQKAAIGQRYYNMIIRGDQQELTGAFTQMARTLNETPLPTPGQLKDPQEMLRYYQQAKVINQMYIGYDQGINYHEFQLGRLTDQALGADAERINATLSHIGAINATLGDFVDQMGSEAFVQSGSKPDPDGLSRIFADRVTLDHFARNAQGLQRFSDLQQPAMHYQMVGMQVAQDAGAHRDDWVSSPQTYQDDMRFTVTGKSPTAMVEIDPQTQLPSVNFGKVQEAQPQAQQQQAQPERSRVTMRELEASERAASAKPTAPERTTEVTTQKPAPQKEHETTGMHR